MITIMNKKCGNNANLRYFCIHNNDQQNAGAENNFPLLRFDFIREIGFNTCCIRRKAL